MNDSVSQTTAAGPSGGILRYQKNRTLDRCPGFLASIQVEAEGGEQFFAGLRADALEIYTAEGRQYLYDREGRPVRFSTPNEYRHRGVSHRGSVSRKRPAEEGGGFERKLISVAELEAECRSAWKAGVRVREIFSDSPRVRHAFPGIDGAREAIGPVLERIAWYSPERLAEEAVRFSEVYQPVPVLPPDHYGSLVLQATEGCSFNTCTFCRLYQGIPFRVRTVERFEEHIEAALEFHGEGLRRLTRIFLGQANALAVPQDRLVRLFECIHRRMALPDPGEGPARPSWAHGHRFRFTDIGSFLDGFTGLVKSIQDYAELRRLGLSRVYLGIESGSAELLCWLRKPAAPEEMIETIRRLKAAGLSADAILLVGVGGTRFEREHVCGTIDFIRRCGLRKGDRVYLSEIVEYGDSEYVRRMNAGDIDRLDRAGLHAQAQHLAKAVRACGLQAVPYRVEPFIY